MCVYPIPTWLLKKSSFMSPLLVKSLCLKEFFQSLGNRLRLHHFLIPTLLNPTDPSLIYLFCPSFQGDVFSTVMSCLNNSNLFPTNQSGHRRHFIETAVTKMYSDTTGSTTAGRVLGPSQGVLKHCFFCTKCKLNHAMQVAL